MHTPRAVLDGPRSLILLSAALSLAGCDCATHCTPADCAGCCDSTGACQKGDVPAACGNQATACSACAQGQSCVAGACTDGGSGSATCTTCNTTVDCPAGAVCVQYAGSDYCGHTCAAATDCASGESCLIAVADDGTQVHVCVPSNGTCGETGCGSCPSGTTCDPISGTCATGGAGGGSGSGGGSAATCGNYDLPTTSSCCTSCTVGTGDCQANGCYGGWWCDRVSCRCHSASPTSCGSGAGGGAGGGSGAGGGGASTADAGVPMGTVGPNGGTVNRLYFAVVGDTRPSVEDDTAHYPTAIITKIYQDIEALSPRPQFVVTTGDYQFARPSGSEGAKQVALYVSARNAFSGTVFPVMGNHECTGASATNCTSTTNNLTAFTNLLLAPIGKTDLYYSVRVDDVAGGWTSKLIFTACNAWSATQKSWLATQLATPTTYSFVVRHMPLSSNGPCNTDMDPMLRAATLDGLLVGHTHTVYFSASNKQLVEGVGGAPITGTANYGFATVEQNAGSGFTVRQYDYQTAQVINTYTLP